MNAEPRGASASEDRSHRAASTGPTVIEGAAHGAERADELLLGTAREAHQAIARRIFDTLDLATPAMLGINRVVRTAHDGVSAGVYGVMGASARGLARGLRELDRHQTAPRLEATASGRLLLAAVNGLTGDKLRDEGSQMAISMAVRHRGADVALTGEGIAAAYPAATGDVVVFVHGLCESEDFWWRGSDEQGGSYGDRLAADAGWSPVYLRVNTGLPIAENGAALAGLLDDLVEVWPTRVRRLVLVGHSMGGLIIRAACVVTTPAGTPWTELVTDVVTLGTPHLGAPLEQVVDLTTKLLGRVPEAAPFGRIFEYRSRGVLDLRSGLARDVENLPHARYRLVGATLAASPRHPVSETAGDLLVRWPSAIGRPRRGPEMFPGAETLHVPGADHFDLLNHPDVYAAIRRWLA
ncbi:GPI inositol-deacylase [Nocardioidaceae bacterium]|nr:GPI inositol-deacylase [Nocardioidaceae bacterium]